MFESIRTGKNLLSASDKAFKEGTNPLFKAKILRNTATANKISEILS